MTCPSCGRTWYRGTGCSCTWSMMAAALRRKKQEEKKKAIIAEYLSIDRKELQIDGYQ